MAALVRLRARSSMHLAEQHQRRDRGCGFEVDIGIAAHAAQRSGKNLRRDCRHHAVDIGHARAQADQREHVGAAVDQRRPERAERTARPHHEHDRRGERKFEPRQLARQLRRACMNPCGQNMLPIAIASSGAVSTTPTQNRRVMSRSSGFSSAAAVTVRGSSAMPQIGHDPGSGRTISGCIGQVYSVRAGGSGNLGFQRHAAGGASSGLSLADLGAHGANVGRRRHRFRRATGRDRLRAIDLRQRRFRPSRRSQHDQIRRKRSGLVQILQGSRLEFFHARGAAEVVVLPAMFVNMFRRGGIHIHPADRVALEGWSWVRGCHKVDCSRRIQPGG